jgi:hypothetical protein
MDNQRLIVVSETLTDFRLGMQLAFRHCPGDKAWSWWEWTPKRSDFDKDRPEEGLGVVRSSPFLVLSWEGGPRQSGEFSKTKHRLPSGMDSALAADFAWSWLVEQDYGSQPDHDGSNHRGFILFNDAWGHVGGDSYAIIAIGSAWAMAGK